MHTRLDLPDGCYAHHAIAPPPACGTSPQVSISQDLPSLHLAHLPRPSLTLSPACVAQAVLIGWQAHTSEIVTLVYVPTMEGLVSASRDCMVRLWTLSGEQVGSLSKTNAYLSLTALGHVAPSLLLLEPRGALP